MVQYKSIYKNKWCCYQGQKQKFGNKILKQCYLWKHQKIQNTQKYSNKTYARSFLWKYQQEKIFKTQVNGKVYHVHGLEETILIDF